MFPARALCKSAPAWLFPECVCFCSSASDFSSALVVSSVSLDGFETSVLFKLEYS